MKIFLHVLSFLSAALAAIIIVWIGIFLRVPVLFVLFTSWLCGSLIGTFCGDIFDKYEL